MFKKLPDFLTSSAGDGKLSARVNSLLLGLLPVIILIAPMFGWQITNGEEGVKLLVSSIAAIEGLIAIVWQIRGWAERNFRKQNKLGKFAENV